MTLRRAPSPRAAAADGPQTILYFCYGPVALYDQAAFAILSLLHICGGKPDAMRIVVYCDRPEAFAGLPVETVLVGVAQLDAWLGGSDYIHRRKTCVIVDALTRYGGKVIFLDTDTYWTGAPARLFARIAPGRACFHIREGFLRFTGTPFDAALAQQLATHDYRLASSERVMIDSLTPMWNTGVVGLHAEDTALMHEALALSDALWRDADPTGAYGAKIHHAEQFAMGYVFRMQRLREAGDCVYHYWPQTAKTAFAARLPQLATAARGPLTRAALADVYAARYRDTGATAWADRGKMAVRALAQQLSIPVKGVRRSV